MSKADKIFKAMCLDIIKNGTDTKGEKVRPHWEDGTSAYTIKQFGVCNRYNLQEEFPALTLRRTALKSAMDEILWIWQRKSNNIHDLNSHIWDSWADKNGSIGKAYGYQMGVKHAYRDVTPEGLKSAFGDRENVCLEMYISGRNINNFPITKEYRVVHGIGTDVWYMDQVDRVIYDLKNNPFSRRIVTSLYNHNDLSEMGLYPCAWSVTFNVTQKGDQKYLNAVLTQRSQDILAANNWNVVQYSLLIMMLAQVCGMLPGQLVHMIADAHIYDRHVPLIKELISREEYPAPIVRLNPDVKDFYSFTTDDLVVEGYKHGEQIKVPVAI